MVSSPGLKKRIELLLMACKDGPAMTMGEVMERASIPKTNASDVSSALYKLTAEGLVAHSRGPSTSLKGPRFVRLYRWSSRPNVKKPDRPTPSPMAGLGIFRI